MLSRRSLIGATLGGALVVISLLTFGAASGRPLAHSDSRDRSAAAPSATSSTHSLSPAQRHAPFASAVAGHLAHHLLPASSSHASSFAGSSPSSRFVPDFVPFSSSAPRLLSAGGKATTSIVTVQQPGSGAAGDLYKDQATLSGGVSYDGLGSITFTLYDARGCGGNVLDTETVSAAANASYTTPTGFAIQTVGTYYWVASFSGDSNNKSASTGCNDEAVTVGKASPGLVTVQQPDSGAAGDLYKDQATLSGGVSLASTDTITFTLYDARGCGGNVLDTETVTVTGNGDYTTPTGFAIQTVGTYYWVASFSGDANNKSAKTGCNDEAVTVGKASPGLVTVQQPDTGAAGDLYKDQATLSGGVSLASTDTIVFTLYDARGCGGNVLDTETVSVTANGSYTTPAGFAIQTVGTYYWVASFSGDANNKKASTACNDEAVTVGKASPSIVTVQQPDSGAAGDLYKDQATLSGGVSLDSADTITFTLYSAKGCDGTPLDTETVTVTGNGSYTTPAGFAIQTVGTYYWVASFSGDANNKKASTGCNDEAVTVGKASPGLVTLQQPDTGAAGDTFKDQATLSGGVSLDSADTITFTLYDARGCGGNVLDTETVSATANGSYTTPAGVAIENAGTYYWVASFSGDANNKSAKTGCNDEAVSVGKASPGLVTVQQPDTGAAGDTFKDQATLSGGVSLDPADTITFTLYSAKGCDGTPLDTETVTVTGNGDYTTPTGFAIQTVGTYYWVASFSGDANNKKASTGCNDEAVSVGKASPGLVTLQQPDTGAAGDTFKDQATLSGGVSLDSADTITFTLYSAKGCNGTPLDTETVSATANGSYTTPAGFAIQTVGTYYWVASFSGDANNKKASTGCNDEAVSVGKASPGLVTLQQPDTGAAGDTFKDQATLSGGVSLDSADTITFTLYSAKGCDGTPLDTETVTVTGNGSYTTPAGFAIQTVGTYYWVASFSGDANNKKASTGCNDEAVSVGKASPGLVTVQQPDSGVVGATYKDQATLSGGVSLDPADTITFTLYDARGCGGNVLDTETVTVTGNGSYTTPAGFAIQTVGTYYWVASFSGDANNKSAKTGCNDEAVSVGKASPGLVTVQQPDSGVVGARYKDQATLSGGVSLDPADTITFTLYDARGCGGNVLDTETVTVTGNGSYTAPAGFAIQTVGTYYWVASFSGDANNKSAKTGCNDEPVTVGKASPSLLTSQQPAAGGIGDTYKDTATLSGAAGLDGSASIRFSLYGAAGCGGEPLDTETVSSVNANGHYTTPNGFAIQNAGTYYWVASFSGDSDNKPVQTGCNDERVTVAANSPSISTKLSASAANAGAKVHDSATLVNEAEGAGGTVTYTVYSDSECANKVADGGTVDVSNGSVPDSNDVAFNTAGTYYWQASYSGDVDNAPATSKCTDEQLVIAPLIDLAVTKAASPSPVQVGNNITWTIVVTNNGPSPATGVTTSDPLPAGNTFVSVSTGQGSCTGGAIVGCQLGTIAAGGTVTITLVTTPTAPGTATNTVTVVGNEAETNTANNTASASVTVNAFIGPGPKPPVIYCVAVSKLSPHQLFVGRTAALTIHLTQHGKAVSGVRVRVSGRKLDMRTKPSNGKGVISLKLRPAKAGILTFTPIASHACGTKRVGVTGVFTPPVTG